MTTANQTRCESCGQAARVRLADGSTWCNSCHVAALRLGYDDDLGRPINGAPDIRPLLRRDLIDLGLDAALADELLDFAERTGDRMREERLLAEAARGSTEGPQPPNEEKS